MRCANFVGMKFGGDGKARAGKNSFPPTPFLFARPSVRFRFCRAERGNQKFFSKNVRAELYNSTSNELKGFFEAKIEYKLVAERSEANQNRLQFPQWCSILELVRTHFAAAGGEEPPANSERLRREISKPPKSPEKQSARTMF